MSGNITRAISLIKSVQADGTLHFNVVVGALDEARLEGIEEARSALGREVLRLLGQRDREDVDGIARAESIVRALAIPHVPTEESPETKPEGT